MKTARANKGVGEWELRTDKRNILPVTVCKNPGNKLMVIESSMG